MENTDSSDVQTETVATQMSTVQQLTTRSPVQWFGDSSFTNLPIGDFQGDYELPAISYTQQQLQKAVQTARDYFNDEVGQSRNHVDSRDMKFNDLYQKVLIDGTPEDYAALQKEINHRQFSDTLFDTFFPASGNFTGHPKDFDCYRQMLGTIEEICGEWSAYSLKYTSRVAEACDTKGYDEVAEIAGMLYEYCGAERLFQF